MPDILPPDKNEIMLPEESPLVQMWHRRFTPKVAALIKAAMAAPALAVAGWLVQNFLQLRGVVNLTASRIDLAFIALALFVVGFALTIGWRHKRMWRVAIFVFLAIGAFVVDYFVPKPQVSNISTPASYVRPTGWRVIEDWQKAELAPILERYPNYTLHILASSVSDEPSDYAKQFKELFAAHKWNVIGPETVPPGQIALNMQLSISDQYWAKPAPEAFTAINSALQFIHIKATPNFVVDPLAHPDELVMWIGPQTPASYPQHIPLELGKVCRNPLEFTDDTMHFLPGDGSDHVRWVRVKPDGKDARFVLGQRMFVMLTGAARSVATSEYFKVQALGTPMPKPDVLDVTLTKELKAGQQVDLKIISDAEIRVRCVDNRQ